MIMIVIESTSLIRLRSTQLSSEAERGVPLQRGHLAQRFPQHGREGGCKQDVLIGDRQLDRSSRSTCDFICQFWAWRGAKWSPAP